MSTGMSTAGVFSRLIWSPHGCHAVAIKREVARLDRRAMTWVSLAGLLLWGLMAVGVYGQESKSLPLIATTRATVLAADGPYDGTYQYRYAVGDRVCGGGPISSLSLREPGREIQVHYNPTNVCDSVTYDPVVNLIVVLVILAAMSAAFAFVGWLCWLSGGPPEVRSWHQS